jgi:mycofactocin system creatininase family protein
MAVSLADLTWLEIAQASTVFVPVGSLEQHGPHLPLDTDTVIAEAVVRALADTLDHAVIAPPLTYTASGEHQGFAGTSSIGTEVLRLTIIELVRSMTLWASRIVFVNWHGGNVSAATQTVAQLVAEGHDVRWIACATEDVDLHAGHTETSPMLHLRPRSVRLHQAEPGNRGTLTELLPAMREGGIKAVSSNGVLGDPTGASSEEGAQVLARIVERAQSDLFD